MKIFKYLAWILVFLFTFNGFLISEDMFLYQVKEGDNLTKIANDFNLEIKDILEYNEINNPNLIYPDQKLKLPLNTTVYTIEKGDTLSQIASEFNIAMEKLIKINDIQNPDLLYENNILKIPEENNFIWPAQGIIKNNYGNQNSEIKRKQNNGLEIKLAKGSPVYAAEKGKIIFSDYADGYGKLITIEHKNDKKTLYANNLRLLVDKGETVDQGQLIAFSGNGLYSDEPYLHFEIREKDIPVDPLKYLNKDYLNNIKSEQKV